MPNHEKSDSRERVLADLRRTSWFFLPVLAIGLAITSLGTRTWQGVATAWLWIFACFTAGTAIGFLFGIPKILQNDQAAADGEGEPREDDERIAYRQQVNTNLTEISDWLTKIIVGLSLINLSKLPPKLEALAQVLASGIDPKSPAEAKAFAYAIIICFSVLGFLFGYLATRLFLAGAFSRADRGALRQQKEQIETLGAQVASLESNQEVLKQSVYPAESGGTLQRGLALESSEGNPIERLREMADEYLHISTPDWAERVRLKDRAANQMCDLILRTGIPKDVLVDLAKKEGNEGIILALAALINLRPEKGDLDRLMRVAPGVSRLHVRYKVLLAVGKLFRTRLVAAGDHKRAEELIDSYRDGADSSLRELISSTLSLIETAERGARASA